MKIFLLFLMMVLSLQAYAGMENLDVQEKKPVKIELDKGKPSNDDTYPRTLIPFTCAYLDGVVQLSLLGEVGEYTLTVTNQSTGESWSVDNALMLQTSAADGIYWVQIEIEDGSMYYGTYKL